MDRKRLLIPALLLLQACSAHQYLPVLAIDNVESFDSRLAFYPAADGREVQVPAMALNIWLPGISGDLYGTANSEALLKAHAKSGADADNANSAQGDADAAPDSSDNNSGVNTLYHISISDAVLSKLQAQAQTYQGNALQLSPADTRILRIAATVNHPYTGQALGDTYWYDARRKTPMLLLYSDRETQISGEIVINGEAVQHDIRLPGAGLYWLRSVKRFGKTSLTAAATPADLELAIKAVD